MGRYRRSGRERKGRREKKDPHQETPSLNQKQMSFKKEVNTTVVKEKEN